MASKSDLAKARNRAKMLAMKSAAEEVRSPENMKKYGEMVAAMIKLRTRLGDSVKAEGADKVPLKALSTKRPKSGGPSYVEVRERDERMGRLSDQTSPRKSNLTRTGQLLDSEAVKSVSTGKVTVGPTGDRDDGKTNAEISGYVSKTRPYNHLSRTETKRVNDQVKRDIRALIKNKLTNAK